MTNAPILIWETTILFKKTLAKTVFQNQEKELHNINFPIWIVCKGNDSEWTPMEISFIALKKIKHSIGSNLHLRRLSPDKVPYNNILLVTYSVRLCKETVETP